MEEMVELARDDPAVDTALLLTRFAMCRVYGDAYWDLVLSTDDPERISTDYERIYFAYDRGDTIYTIRIGRDGPVMEQVSEGVQLRYRVYSMLGELLFETRSSLGDPEMN